MTLTTIIYHAQLSIQIFLQIALPLGKGCFTLTIKLIKVKYFDALMSEISLNLYSYKEEKFECKIFAQTKELV